MNSQLMLRGTDILIEILSWLNLRELTILMLSGDSKLHYMVKNSHIHNLSLKMTLVNARYFRIGGICLSASKSSSCSLPWFVSELKSVSSIDIIIKKSYVDTISFDLDHWTKFGGLLQRLHLHTCSLFQALIKRTYLGNSLRSNSIWTVRSGLTELWKSLAHHEETGCLPDIWLPLNTLLPSLTDLRASCIDISSIPDDIGIQFLKALPVSLERLDTCIFPSQHIIAENFAPSHLTALKLRGIHHLNECSLPLSLTCIDFRRLLPNDINWQLYPYLRKLKLIWNPRYETTPFPKTLDYLGFYGRFRLQNADQYFTNLPCGLRTFVGADLLRNVKLKCFPPTLTSLKLPHSRVDIEDFPNTLTKLSIRCISHKWADNLPSAIRHLELSQNPPSASLMQHLHTLKVKCSIDEEVIVALPTTVRLISCRSLALCGASAASHPHFLPNSRTLTKRGLISCARKWASWIQHTFQRSIFYTYATVKDLKYCPTHAIDTFDPTFDIEMIKIWELPPTMTQFPSTYTCRWDELPLLPPALKSYRNVHVIVPSEIVTQAIKKNGSKIGNFFVFPDSILELLTDQLSLNHDGMSIEMTEITDQMITWLPASLKTLAYRKGLYEPSQTPHFQEFASASSITRLSLLEQTLSANMSCAFSSFKNLVALAFQPASLCDDALSNYFRSIPSTVTELTLYHQSNTSFQPAASTLALLPLGLLKLRIHIPLDSIENEHLEALPQLLKSLSLRFRHLRPTPEFLSQYRPSLPHLFIHSSNCNNAHSSCYSRRKVLPSE